MNSKVSVNEEDLKSAYRQAGLDDKAAARILLDRFTYGARPGELEAVLAKGLAPWLQEQLQAALPESALEARLADYDALQLSNAELFQRYPSSSLVAAHARRFFEGVLPHRDEPVLDFTVVAAQRDAFALEQGFRPPEELRTQVFGQKILRAAHAENQLAELLTDFWQNHFFSSAASFESQPWLLSYERDALRPNALGSFHELLSHCVSHPALIGFYLYNESPAEVAREQSTLGMKIAALRASGMDQAELDALLAAAEQEIAALDYERDLILQREFWALQGPNLPFASALLRLMTLGPEAQVDDKDILESARILTGWSTQPQGPTADWFQQGLDKAQELGFARRGSFLFRADWHDAREKRLLGQHFPAGHGLDEGERLLALLASHQDSARHISHKLAVRFAGDTPSPALLEHLALAFQDSGGDTAALLLALGTHPDFWRLAAARDKAKNPLEYAISALRAVEADIGEPLTVVQWVAQMGRPLYSYQEPTGYPDLSAYWLNGSNLATRINYAQALASNRLEGVQIASNAAQKLALQLAGPDFQLR